MPLTILVTLGKLLRISKTWLPHLINGWGTERLLRCSDHLIMTGDQYMICDDGLEAESSDFTSYVRKRSFIKLEWLF